MKSYTDLEQSKKLAEILSLDSADMYYHPYPNDEDWYDIPNFGEADLKFNQLPCWSLAALLNVLLDCKLTKIIYYNLENPYTKYFITNNHPELFTSEYYNAIDACYEMLLTLHELKML